MNIFSHHKTIFCLNAIQCRLLQKCEYDWIVNKVPDFNTQNANQSWVSHIDGTKTTFHRNLAILCNTQNYGGFRICPSSGILETYLFPPSSEKGKTVVRTKMKSLSALCISYETGISEKLKRIGNRYKFMIIFKTKYTSQSSVKRTRPERDQQQTAQGEKLHWRNRQTSSCVAPWTQGRLQRFSRKIKISPAYLWRVKRKDGIKLRFRKLEVTAAIGNERNRPMWPIPISLCELDIYLIWHHLTAMRGQFSWT
jgi:hypothetical protein